MTDRAPAYDVRHLFIVSTQVNRGIGTSLEGHGRAQRAPVENVVAIQPHATTAEIPGEPVTRCPSRIGPLFRENVRRRAARPELPARICRVDHKCRVRRIRIKAVDGEVADVAEIMVEFRVRPIADARTEMPFLPCPGAIEHIRARKLDMGFISYVVINANVFRVGDADKMDDLPFTAVLGIPVIGAVERSISRRAAQRAVAFDPESLVANGKGAIKGVFAGEMDCAAA